MSGDAMMYSGDSLLMDDRISLPLFTAEIICQWLPNDDVEMVALCLSVCFSDEIRCAQKPKPNVTRLSETWGLILYNFVPFYSKFISLLGRNRSKLLLMISRWS